MTGQPSPFGVTKLPSFKRPPVAELSLSIQFAPLSDLRAAHLGVFWTKLKTEFPKTEQQPTLPHVIEHLGEPGHMMRMDLEIEIGVGVPRFWFMNGNGTELIQIQQDRFAQNWRKLETDVEYPHYARVRKTFESRLDQYSAFLAEENLGRLSPDQCEVVYVDHIDACDVWSTHGELHRIFPLCQEGSSRGIVEKPEEARIELRYPIRTTEGKTAGRLHVSVNPAYRKRDGKPIFVMQSVGRGAPLGEGIKGALDFMDLAHDWLVRSFVALTTPEMHRVWELDK